MNLLSFKPVRRRVIGAVEKHPVAFLIFAALYIISPIDLLPEAVFGPLGAFDDVLMAMIAWAVLKGLWRRRRAAAAERKRIEAKQWALDETERAMPERRPHPRPDHRRGPVRHRRHGRSRTGGR